MSNHDPYILTIKVIDNEHRCFYVDFNRQDHALVKVRELKTIYTPGMGIASRRTKEVIEAASTRLNTPAVAGEVQ